MSVSVANRLIKFKEQEKDQSYRKHYNETYFFTAMNIYISHIHLVCVTGLSNVAPCKLDDQISEVSVVYNYLINRKQVIN